MPKYYLLFLSIFPIVYLQCTILDNEGGSIIKMTRSTFSDKMKGAWAGQLIGVTYGYPVEFKYNTAMVPDTLNLCLAPGTMQKVYKESPGAYDDIYVELTFLDVYSKNSNASAREYAEAFGKTNYWLWFANQMARNNIRNGILPKKSGHWIWNPECTSIDFQIEADFIGLLYPGLRAQALSLADSIGHIMAYGDGYYGGVFVSQMYAAAFITDDIQKVIADGLAAIPEKSRFFQMISDVIEYHNIYPDDWKANWKFISDKYSNENGSPFGVFDPWNIEASMNSAHVVTGLLYGGGDFEKTMDIATRCGNDADCNPATAAGVLGTIMGFNKIPDKYKKEVVAVYDWKFLDSEYSLGIAIEVTEKLALENIEENGGKISDTVVVISPNKASLSELEVARPNHYPTEKINLWRSISIDDPSAHEYLTTLPKDKRTNLINKRDSLTLATDLFSGEYSFSFSGNGYCVLGKVVNEAAGEWNFTDDTTSASVFIDGQFKENVFFPIGFDNRRFLAFFDYTLEQGQHHVRIVAKGKRVKDYRFELYNTIIYEDQNVE